MAKFTPGPWEFADRMFSDNKSQGSIPIIVYSDPEKPYIWIADIKGSHVGPGHEEANANARLIAAAPEMYEIVHWLAKNASEQWAVVKDAIKLLKKIDGEDA